MIDSNLWYRDTEIMFGGVKYTLNNEFWENLIGNSENERALLKAYYTHKDLSLLEDEKKSVQLLEILKKHSCSEILKIIEEGFEPAKIDKKDISQFSDFKDAYYTVPFILQNCGTKDVDYSKMENVFCLFGKETKGLPEDVLKKYLENKG